MTVRDVGFIAWYEKELSRHTITTTVLLPPFLKCDKRRRSNFGRLYLANGSNLDGSAEQTHSSGIPICPCVCYGAQRLGFVSFPMSQWEETKGRQLHAAAVNLNIQGRNKRILRECPTSFVSSRERFILGPGCHSQRYFSRDLCPAISALR